MHRSAAIVLVFTVSYTLANMYDTLLWALDAPGYVTRSQAVNGTTISPFLLQNPSYVTIINDPDHDLDRIDVNETLTSNLFKPGFNFSFPPSSYVRSPAAIMPPPLMNKSEGIGPRIYLDDEGFGVSFGQQLVSWMNDDKECPMDEVNELLMWYCNIPNTQSTRFLSQPAGQPLVWWDNDYDKTAYVTPSRSDNPWATYGTGGDTAVMKQVFTLTKGNKRHTFLQTTLKLSMVTRNTFPDDEIKAMARRIYTVSNNTLVADTFAQRCIDTQTNGINSSTTGFMMQDQESAYIGWSSIEFINIVNDNFPTERLMRLLRIHDVTIELVRSETIPKPAEPAVPCELWNVNVATGGRVRSNDCYKSSVVNQTDAHFLGQIDTSSVAIIVDILGDGKNDTNVVAFNQTGADWYTFNRTWIDQLLMSRAFLLGGDRNTVNLLIHHNEPAISYLQILLTIFPFFLALTAFGLMYQDKPGYYKSSLFASLVATTHLAGEDKSCDSVGYLRRPPNVILQRIEEHVRLGMDDGSYVVNSGEGRKHSHAQDPSLSPLLSPSAKESLH